MRRDACLPHAFDAFLLDQSTESVECPSSLEGADFLLVLTFEEQLYLRVGCSGGSIAGYFFRVRRRFTGYIRPRTWTAFGSWRRGNLVYCLTGDCGCSMDVFLDSLVGSLYR